MTIAETLEFPCEIPIKVMGKPQDLRAITQAIIERHAGSLDESKVRTRPSADGNYIALTYLIRAESRAQMDTIYRELSACKSVLMAL